MYSKICPQCNKEFKTKHKIVKCCSHKCSALLKRTYNPNKKCLYCNKDFIAKYKTHTFCSNKCRGLYNTTTPIIKKCLVCEKDFKSVPDKIDKKTNKSFENKYCCRECYDISQKKQLETRQCSTCGKDVTRAKHQLKSDIVYCSVECTRKTESQICKVCDVEFCAFMYRKANNIKGFTIVRPKRATCSTKCTIEYFKTNEDRKEKISKAFSGDKHPNYVNGCSKNYRIRKTDKKENFSKRDKQELLLKFNNKCFKCGSNERLTIDHNVPFSQGGRLTFSNSVVLCLSCNSRKNAKMPQMFYSGSEIKKLERLGIVSDSLFNFEYV